MRGLAVSLVETTENKKPTVWENELSQRNGDNESPEGRVVCAVCGVKNRDDRETNPLRGEQTQSERRRQHGVAQRTRSMRGLAVSRVETIESCAGKINSVSTRATTWCRLKDVQLARSTR